MKITDFWDVMLCKLAEVHRCFRGNTLILVFAAYQTVITQTTTIRIADVDGTCSGMSRCVRTSIKNCHITADESIVWEALNLFTADD